MRWVMASSPFFGWTLGPISTPFRRSFFPPFSISNEPEATIVEVLHNWNLLFLRSFGADDILPGRHLRLWKHVSSLPTSQQCLLETLTFGHFLLWTVLLGAYGASWVVKTWSACTPSPPLLRSTPSCGNFSWSAPFWHESKETKWLG